jgi:hypothetical protein
MATAEIETPNWLDTYLQQTAVPDEPSALDRAVRNGTSEASQGEEVEQLVLQELFQVEKRDRWGRSGSGPPGSVGSVELSSPTLDWEAKRNSCSISQLPPMIRSQCLRVDKLFTDCRALLQQGGMGKYRGVARAEECICNDETHRQMHLWAEEEEDGQGKGDSRHLMRLTFHATERDLRALFTPERLGIVCVSSDMIQNDWAISINGIIVWRVERKAQDLIPSLTSHLWRSEAKTMEMSSFRVCQTLLLVESPVEWNASDATSRAYAGPTEREYDIRYLEASTLHSKGMHFRRTHSLVGTAMSILLDLYAMLKNGCRHYEQMFQRPHLDPCLGYAGPMDCESLGEEYLSCALEFAQRKFKPGDLCRTPSTTMVKMLNRIHGVSEEMARGIQNKYPSMYQLWQALENAQETDKEAAALATLSDCPYRASGASKARKTGKQNAIQIMKAIYSKKGKQLLQGMLQCITGIGVETSQDMIRVFPSLASLLEALRETDSALHPKPWIKMASQVPKLKETDAKQVYDALCGETQSLKDTRAAKTKSYMKKKGEQEADPSLVASSSLLLLSESVSSSSLSSEPIKTKTPSKRKAPPAPRPKKKHMQPTKEEKKTTKKTATTTRKDRDPAEPSVSIQVKAPVTKRKLPATSASLDATTPVNRKKRNPLPLQVIDSMSAKTNETAKVTATARVMSKGKVFVKTRTVSKPLVAFESI